MLSRFQTYFILKTSIYQGGYRRNIGQAGEETGQPEADTINYKVPFWQQSKMFPRSGRLPLGGLTDNFFIIRKQNNKYHSGILKALLYISL